MQFLIALLLFPLALAEGIAWQHQGLEGMEAALADARKQDRLVLVGLSGSDR